MTKNFHLATIFELHGAFGIIALTERQSRGTKVGSYDPCLRRLDSTVFPTRGEALDHFHTIVGQSVVNGWKPIFQGQARFG